MPELSYYENIVKNELLRKERVYERRIAALWRNSLDQMRVEMAKIYDKYAVEGVLTRAQMTQYNRYATMEKQLMDTMAPAITKTKGQLTRMRPEQYNAAFFHSAWAMDSAAEVRIAWGVLNPDVVLESLASEYVKISLERYGPEARVIVRSALNDGLSIGKSYPKMMKDLKKALNTTNYKAMRILRTEGQDVVNAGTDDAYNRAAQAGIEGLTVWSSTLDAETRDTHQAMDQQVRKEDGFFNGPGGFRAPYPVWEGLSAKERIHCRCNIRYEIEGYGPQIRRSREQGLVAPQPYSEWEKGLNARGKSTNGKVKE